MAGNREFFNRRLHSLLGVIPIGFFLCLHLVVNHFATGGVESFNHAANFMESLPFLHILEWIFIFLPLLYHAIYGLYIAFTATANVGNFGFFRNWMYLLQRITGVITLIFIAWHVWETRIAMALGTALNFQMMHHILSHPGMFVFYAVGIVCAIFHFSNGLWSFMVSWGITITPRSQVISTYVTMIIFLLLSIIGIQTLFAFI
ncbi:succinate dehydrogenase [Bacillus sp. BRMEA1]|uniref:succinate dehydrogenase cytochrome b558 subunit n=1 Tax=Neobacillus endophyticus TaxID=2738405 RepID=UPI001563B685|nr:succinate dehydrogenase cytochrome b558 subunit [Neobacillus endophyticus]NRD76046.1 succinate dehydrogenase [Neobacillus endophyticus]